MHYFCFRYINYVYYLSKGIVVLFLVLVKKISNFVANMIMKLVAAIMKYEVFFFLFLVVLVSSLNLHFFLECRLWLFIQVLNVVIVVKYPFPHAHCIEK